MKTALLLGVTTVILLAVTSVNGIGISAGTVQTTLALNFSINNSDIIYIGENASTATNVWYANNLTKRYMCAQNQTSYASNVMVSVASGGGFRKLNFTAGAGGANHTVAITQDYGSPYYIIFTDANCTPALKSAQSIENGRLSVYGSVPSVSVRGVTAWITYPRLNFTQELRLARGTWEAIVENNGTVKNVTRVKVRRL
ncbi:MAG: hypothetical protein HY366_00105 [Candidatus Aenigmarchaeota archaeon]|nr:hypothetical protein [Candidatus Aenigmarchaeota archaeon]